MVSEKRCFKIRLENLTLIEKKRNFQSADFGIFNQRSIITKNDKALLTPQIMIVLPEFL